MYMLDRATARYTEEFEEWLVRLGQVHIAYL